MNFGSVIGYLGELNLTTSQTIELAKTIMPMVESVKKDEELNKIFKKRISAEQLKKEGKTDEEILELGNKVGNEIMIELASLIVIKYDNFIYKILSALNGKSVKEVKEQKISETLDQVLVVLMNKHIKDFFTSATELEGQEP